MQYKIVEAHWSENQENEFHSRDDEDYTCVVADDAGNFISPIFSKYSEGKKFIESITSKESLMLRS